MRYTLSAAAAVRCETATGKTCNCRCGGAFHGAARGKISTLPTTDPHSPSVLCSYCGGEGKVQRYGENGFILKTCPTCLGSGRVVKRTTLEKLRALEAQ